MKVRELLRKKWKVWNILSDKEKRKKINWEKKNKNQGSY